MDRALAKKLKPLMFSRNRKNMVGNKKFFLVQPVEQREMPFLERNISEHDIMQ